MTRSILTNLPDTPGYRTPAAERNRHPRCNSVDWKAKKRVNVDLVAKRRASEDCSDTALVGIFAKRCRVNSSSTVAKSMDNTVNNSRTQNTALRGVGWTARLPAVLPNGATTLSLLRLVVCLTERINTDKLASIPSRMLTVRSSKTASTSSTLRTSSSSLLPAINRSRSRTRSVRPWLSASFVLPEMARSTR